MQEQKMQLVDWLDDLCVRFIINLPQEELESVARICFQIEEAQWFYEDFIRPIDPTLPSMNLKQFSLKILGHCPLTSSFSDEQHLAAYQEFLGYKTRVPVRGAIMLNPDMDHVLLVKGWSKSASWSFPRGKINKDEDDLDCAVREVWEETGFDISEAGLVPDRDAVKAIDITMRDQNMRLFVFRNVPMDTHFEPKTRKEISKIQWYRLNDLPTLKKNRQGHQSDGGEAYNPNKFYMVAPFLQPLKKWIVKQRKMDLLQEDETEEMPSEAYVEEQPSQLPEISMPQPGLHDPAAELKRLLSVQALQPVPISIQQSQMPTNQQQASQLLAMLNGSASRPQQQFQRQPSEIPITPMEQILGQPQQPQSPHVSHVHESPFSRAQPPPQFPSQQGLGQLQAHSAQQDTAFQGQLSGLSGRSNLLRMFQQQSIHAQHQQLFQFVEQHQPQQQDPPPSQIPIPPPSSSLPLPRLNNHAMNLLSAFKTGPGSVKPVTNPALLQTVRQNPPPRDAHQNSLLDLFKAPIASPSPPVAAPNVAVDGTIPTAATPETDAFKPIPPPTGPRRASAMSMITRTLPRTKTADRKPSAPVPSMDNDNFPTLGSTPLAPKAKLAQAAVSPLSSPQQPTKILSRQGPASADQTSRPVSRGKLSVAQQPLTILQRPASASKPPTSPRQKPIPTGPANGTARPSFQPQILRRGDPPPIASKVNPEPAISAPPPKAPAQSQRNALLSLFAQTQPTKQQPTPPLASPTSFGASSNNAATSFVPTQVLSRSTSQNQPSGPPGAIGSERARMGSSSSVTGMSRQGSMGGVVRHGSLAGELGPKSPGTPVEARGFLMDYLEGVAKGAK
ncbi:hypothetical protein KVT40_000905 [Elsinoe batatas]|uniref:Nudix hydrolase domain-containing protein n=1 Tax=Elsinoe batatas TaxID=2601811 RepID=A0A8K0LCW5_9PEZI|nr:hypothetical protein KVT40_000905 [Elsinoe batatas]